MTGSGIFRKKLPLTAVAAVLALFDTVAYHSPFFSHAIAQASGGANGVIIIASLALLLLALNFLAFYLLLFCFRGAGRGIITFFFIANAASLYAINTYDIMLDDTMMGNVFNTNKTEATSYLCWNSFQYIILLGVLPSVLLWLTKIDSGSFKRFAARVGISVAVALGIGMGNMSNWPWIDKNSTVLGSLILPWSYVVNTARYNKAMKDANREEIKLPDLSFADSTRSAVVIVIGESVRRDHLSIYGYSRQTTPELDAIHGVKTYKANSAATYTIEGVKAILTHKPSGDLYEILPNYLHRCGVDVTYTTSNWGEPPVHIEKYENFRDKGFDEILFDGLAGRITASGKPKVFVCIHTSTSHGPSYNKKYPAEFEKFTPVCTTVEMSSADPAELANSYDNTILYTDHLLAGAVRELETLAGEGWRTALIFVSDHGESLGENNLYMHGVPISIAPREQYEIPFVVWSSDPSQQYKDFDLLTQYSTFHSTLHFLGLKSEVYDESLNIFK